MKNIIKSVLFIITFSVVFTACQDDEYDKPNNFSDAGFIHSGFRSEVITLNIDKFASFSDMSQGTTSHKWIIEEGSFFLQGPIERRDTIFDKFIKTPIELESEDKTVHVLFKEGGLNKVRLYNEFDEYVEVRGAEATYPSKFIDGKYVIDTTLFVDVYEKIVPEMLIRQDGAVVDHTDSTAVITVEAGGTLEFVDMTTIGRPTNRYFNIGGEEYTDSVSVVPFFKLGNYKGNFRLTREDPNLPNGYGFYRIPATVKVIPSSLPFEVAGDLVELENQSIEIPFSGEFAPFADPKAHFTVNVAGVGSIPIESVSLKQGDATTLVVKLSDPIYRNDVVTVSYDGNSSMESSDTRKPVAFTDMPVNMFQHILKVYDFEDSTNLNHKAQWNSKGDGSISTEQALNGSHSFKLECGSRNGGAGGNWSAFHNQADFFTIEGDVVVEMIFSFYKTDGFTGPGNLHMGPWLAPGGNNWGAGNKQYWDNTVVGAPVNQWTTVVKKAGHNNSATKDNFSYYIRTNGSGTLYFDDIMYRVEDYRP